MQRAVSSTKPVDHILSRWCSRIVWSQCDWPRRVSVQAITKLQGPAGALVHRQGLRVSGQYVFSAYLLTHASDRARPPQGNPKQALFPDT
jgi:hypothetical protein